MAIGRPGLGNRRRIWLDRNLADSHDCASGKSTDRHGRRAAPGVEIRIGDRDQSTGHGEIQAHGPNVFSGYLHLPDHSAEAFTSDGWFRTGDLGYVDRDGCLHLVGRASSRMTLPGGEKIWPSVWKKF